MQVWIQARGREKAYLLIKKEERKKETAFRKMTLQ